MYIILRLARLLAKIFDRWSVDNRDVSTQNHFNKMAKNWPYHRLLTRDENLNIVHPHRDAARTIETAFQDDSRARNVKYEIYIGGVRGDGEKMARSLYF